MRALYYTLSRNSKLKIKPQPDHNDPVAALRTVHRRNPAEVWIVDVRIRVAKNRRVGRAVWRSQIGLEAAYGAVAIRQRSKGSKLIRGINVNEANIFETEF